MSGCQVIGPPRVASVSPAALAYLAALAPARGRWQWWRALVWRLRHGQTRHGAAWCVTHERVLCVDYRGRLVHHGR